MSFIYKYYFKFFFILFCGFFYLIDTPALIDLSNSLVFLNIPIYVTNFYLIYTCLAFLGDTYYERELKKLSGQEKDEYRKKTYKKESLRHISTFTAISILYIGSSFFSNNIFSFYTLLASYLFSSWIKMFFLRGIDRALYFKNLIEFTRKNIILIYPLLMLFYFLDQYFSWNFIYNNTESDHSTILYVLLVPIGLLTGVCYLCYFKELKSLLNNIKMWEDIDQFVESKTLLGFIGHGTAILIGFLASVTLGSLGYHGLVYIWLTTALIFFFFTEKFSTKYISDFRKE